MRGRVMGDSALFGTVVFSGGNVVIDNFDVSGNTPFEGLAGKAWDKSSEKVKKTPLFAAFLTCSSGLVRQCQGVVARRIAARLLLVGVE